MRTFKIILTVLWGSAIVLGIASYAGEGLECSADQLKEIRKRFKAAVHESVSSCHRSKGPHTTAQFEKKLTELKATLKKRIGDKKATKIQRAEEDLWAQLGLWSSDTNDETSELFNLLFNDASQHLDRYKSCGAKLYKLTSSKDDWSPQESRAVLNAIKCMQKGASDAYGKYFKNLDGYVRQAKKSDSLKDQKNYARAQKQVRGFFQDLKELSYLTRCTELRQRRDQTVAELKACKQNVVIDENAIPQDNASVPDCVPEESDLSPKNAQELRETGEKLRGTTRLEPQE